MRVGSLGTGDGNSAMVRELHVFGPEVSLGDKRVEAAQHRGLGSELIEQAEKIARDEFQASQIAILSGVGARDYFRSEFGYELDKAYMVRRLK